MLFYVRYGTDGCEDVAEIINADNLEAAELYAHESAIESFTSFEGMYGNLTLEEFAEENDYDNFCSIDCVEEYAEYVEGEIFYSAEEYNENIEQHSDALEDNNGKIFEV